MTGYMQDAARAMKENEDLRKEIGRLRDALKMISLAEESCGGTFTYKEIADASTRIAKEALK